MIPNLAILVSMYVISNAVSHPRESSASKPVRDTNQTTSAAQHPMMFSADFRLAPCDWNSPCPPGMKCQVRQDVAPHRFLCYPDLPGGRSNNKISKPFDKSNFGVYNVNSKDFQEKIQMLNDMQCPAKGEVATCKPCVGVDDCGRGLVCCPTIDGKRSCTAPRGAADATTKLVSLITGKYQVLNPKPLVSERQGSVTLLQTQGLNILIDTGPSSSSEELVQRLEQHGLDPDDIYLVIMTHGHPDHYGASHLFKCPHIYGRYRVNGDIYVDNGLDPSGRNYLCTRNAYIIFTPGHSYDDISVIVERVPNLGRVGIVGDLFMRAEDLQTPAIWKQVSNNVHLQQANRKKILCFVDTIIPGHGTFFNVSSTMRADYDCSSDMAL